MPHCEISPIRIHRVCVGDEHDYRRKSLATVGNTQGALSFGIVHRSRFYCYWETPKTQYIRYLETFFGHDSNPFARSNSTKGFLNHEEIVRIPDAVGKVDARRVPIAVRRAALSACDWASCCEETRLAPSRLAAHPSP